MQERAGALRRLETGWALRTGWAHMSMRAWAPRVRDDHCKTWKQSWILTAVALLKQKGLGPNEKHERKALEKHTGKYEKNALGLRKKRLGPTEKRERNALEKRTGKRGRNALGLQGRDAPEDWGGRHRSRRGRTRTALSWPLGHGGLHRSNLSPMPRA